MRWRSIRRTFFLGKSTNVTDNVTADKRPQKRLVVWIASGMLLYGIGGVWFSIREWAEMDFIYLFLAGGVLLLLIGVFAAFLKWRRTKEAYYQSMFQWNAFYYRFWKNMGSLCFLSLVHVCILAIFAVQLIGTMTKQELEEMYPYDYVYKAYEADLPKMQEIIRENQNSGRSVSDAGHDFYLWERSAGGVGRRKAYTMATGPADCHIRIYL